MFLCRLCEKSRVLLMSLYNSFNIICMDIILKQKQKKVNGKAVFIVGLISAGMLFSPASVFAEGSPAASSENSSETVVQVEQPVLQEAQEEQKKVDNVESSQGEAVDAVTSLKEQHRQRNEEEKAKIKSPRLKLTMLSTRIVRLSWKGGTKAQKYIIYNQSKEKKTKLKTTKKKSFVVRGLKPGKTYKFSLVTVARVKNKTVKAEVRKTIKLPKKLKRSTKGFSKTNAAKVTKMARKKVGRPYVLGASGPNRFDCSGFVYYINKKAKVSGKYFSRGTAQSEHGAIKKYSVGRKYSRAQPGDIVFISASGSKRNITHVAYYYGDNKLVHATNPRCGVQLTSTNWNGGQRNVVDICRLPNM